MNAYLDASLAVLEEMLDDLVELIRPLGDDALNWAPLPDGTNSIAVLVVRAGLPGGRAGGGDGGVAGAGVGGVGAWRGGGAGAGRAVGRVGGGAPGSVADRCRVFAGEVAGGA